MVNNSNIHFSWYSAPGEMDINTHEKVITTNGTK